MQLLDLSPITKRFAAAIRFARQRSHQSQAMPFDSAAAPFWSPVYDELQRPRVGRLAQVTARAVVIVRRLAVLYAVLDASRQVRRVHLEAALELYRYGERSARLIFGEGDRDAATEKVLSLIVAAGKAGITWYDLTRRSFHGRENERLKRILADLSSQGLVLCETVSRSKPTQVWKSVC